MNSPSKNPKNQYIPLLVLDIPPKSSFTIAKAPNSSYTLIQNCDPKKQLFTNLSTYQWRRQTQFPISKTHYVNIKTNNHDTNDLVQLLVYNQHCPIRLTKIDNLSLPQVLYILKESFIGFERLSNKFGFFNITDNMIRINEKGYCRVWVHENFACNNIMSSELSEQKMIETSLRLVQKYCDSTRSIKNLFQKLRACKNFLNCLKQIDLFSINSKVSIPCRYVPNSIQPLKSQKYKNLVKSIKSGQFSSKNLIFSGIRNKQNNINKINECVSLEKYSDKSIAKNRIKKIKSTNSLALEDKHLIDQTINSNKMKISDGQTAHTRNINHKKNNTNIGDNMVGSYSKKLQFQLQTKDKMESDKWLQQSSFTIGGQQVSNTNRNIINNKNINKDKKDLSYSQALINPEINKLRLNVPKINVNMNRSSSMKRPQFYVNSLPNSPKLKTKSKVNKFTNFNIQTVVNNKNGGDQTSTNEPIRNLFGNSDNKPNRPNRYSSQINNVLEDNKIDNKDGGFDSNCLNNSSRDIFCSPRDHNKGFRQSINHILQSSDDYQDQKLRESHTYQIMKNNGWKFTNLNLNLSVNKNIQQQEGKQQNKLNESFQEGQEENLYLNQIKFQKLQSLGRRIAAMSILPQEYQELY